MKSPRTTRIVFTGGGTLGPVMPLLAIAEKIREDNKSIQIGWIGTRQGPEREMVTAYRIPFKCIFAGKLRRYLSIRNVSDPILLILGFFQSLRYLARYRPRVVINAGSFVGVPVVWAAWFLRIPVVIFQLDLVVSLANKLAIPFASRIGVACVEEKKHFPAQKTSVVGIPVPYAISSLATQHQNAVKEELGFSKDIPVILVMGGGTGAADINKFVWESLPALTGFATVIHITGKGKESYQHVSDRYFQFPFLTHELPRYYAAADLVVARAGMGTLSSCSALGKPMIIIPLPNSQQEFNAVFAERHGAARYLSQISLTSESFKKEILRLLERTDERAAMAKAIRALFPSDSASQAWHLLQKVL